MKIFYLIIINLVLTIFFSSILYADTTYTIKKGDTPYDIAKRFKVSPHDILKTNNLRPKNLKPGSKIVIPSKQKDASLTNTPARKQDRRTAPDNGKKSHLRETSSLHIVKKGDTLFSLSKKYSIPVNELKKINNLRSKKIKPGQQIIVKKTGPKTYTLKKGDTIYQVAKKFHRELNELRDINGLETDFLQPGQKILLASDEQVDEAKTYAAILSQDYREPKIEETSESQEHSETGLQERLILFAEKLLDIPYRFGGNSLFGIDCSAYVKKVYSLIGIDLPRSAREQFQEGMPVDENELSIGDLVFFRTYASFPSHVGIYLGNNLFIHASSRSMKVTIDSLDTPYYLKRFIGAKRLIDFKDEKEDPQKEG